MQEYSKFYHFQFNTLHPSKATPFKLWLAGIARERLDKLQDPGLTFDLAMKQYLQPGYSENWINQHLKSIEVRKKVVSSLNAKAIHLLNLKNLSENSNLTGG